MLPALTAAALPFVPRDGLDRSRWTTPGFDGDQLVSPAYVTVLHNGIMVHHHTALLGPTQHRQLASYRPHPPKGPLRLQDHGAGVRYRNIWYRPLQGYDEL